MSWVKQEQEDTKETTEKKIQSVIIDMSSKFTLIQIQKRCSLSSTIQICYAYLVNLLA